jgi:hypothetical protein
MRFVSRKLLWALPNLLAAVALPMEIQAGTVTYLYTGSNQTFTVPAGVSRMNVELWGAGGGDFGGSGGFVSGTLTVTPYEGLTIVVGGGGTGTVNSFAFGGGGAGGAGNGQNAPFLAGGGGGYSGIFSAATPLVVVGAGGGGEYTFSVGGGGGGGLVGGSNGGGGGTQSTGGLGEGGPNATDGGYLQGGNGANDVNAFFGGGGGGGGYYGGGGGGGLGGYQGGGGGSSYVALLSGTVVNLQGNNGYNPGPGAALNTSDPNYQSGVGVGGLGQSLGGPGEVVLTFTAATPEPSQFVPLTALMGGICWLIRRKQSESRTPRG